MQIGDENVHRVRALMDEVFGPGSFVVSITVKKKGSQISNTLDAVNDYVLWYGKNEKASGQIKSRPLFTVKESEELLESYGMVELAPFECISVKDLEKRDGESYSENFERFRTKYPTARLFGLNPLKSGGYRKNQSLDFFFQSRKFLIGDGQCWKHTVRATEGQTPGMDRTRQSRSAFSTDKRCSICPICSNTAN